MLRLALDLVSQGHAKLWQNISIVTVNNFIIVDLDFLHTLSITYQGHMFLYKTSTPPNTTNTFPFKYQHLMTLLVVQKGTLVCDHNLVFQGHVLT